jgi:hypothetical protein
MATNGVESPSYVSVRREYITKSLLFSNRYDNSFSKQRIVEILFSMYDYCSVIGTGTVPDADCF